MEIGQIVHPISWLETIKKILIAYLWYKSYRVGIKNFVQIKYYQNNWNELENDEQPEEEL